MKRLLLLVLVAAYCLLPTAYSAAQCPGGNCPVTLTPSSRRPVTPSSSYRYVEPAGHYRAVVRVRGDVGAAAMAHKLGSGVAVRWNEKIVVLTAAHVAKNCKRVAVYLSEPKRWAPAATVKLDDRWDVAILTLAHADAAQLEPADIAWGEDATPKQDARLESCGLGPDGRLAVNSGVLLAYRSNGSGRSADWLDISGPARQGDSGGPVFDAKGQVVGILWGTDGRSVTATQGGYLHKLLADSLGPWGGGMANDESQITKETRSTKREGFGALGFDIPSSFDIRHSTLDDPVETCAGKLLPGLRHAKTPAPAPAPPQVIVNADPEVRSGLKQIEGTLGQVAQNTAPKSEPPPADAAPGWAKILCLVAAIAVGAFVFYVVQQN